MGRCGFSLAEVMIAFLLLSVVSLVLTGLIPATITGMHKAAMRSNAGLLATNTLAQLKQIGFGRLEPSVTPTQVAGVDYQVEVTVEAAPLSNGATMENNVAKLVSVTVTWKDRNGPQRHVNRAVVFKRI